MAKRNTRLIIALILKDVVSDKRSLDAALETRIPNSLTDQDKAFVRAMSYGTLRWYIKLELILAQLLHKPFRKKDYDLKALAILGLYQLSFTRVKPHAAVSETVSATKQLGKSWAAAAINAVLRNYQRNQETIDQNIGAEQWAETAHPRWLYDAIRDDWPEQSHTILMANNQQAPMTLRVNRRKCTPQTYLKQLTQCDLDASLNPFATDAIALKEAVNTHQLPNFDNGHISVQDAAAQMAAHLLDARPGQRILDSCAAPGGKTCHLLEITPELDELIALDKDARRIEKIKENLHRLELHANIICADAKAADKWWDGHQFDRILLDTPCSATGVIRRHPDIKLLRTESDIESLVITQRTLLDSLWLLLKPGGQLLYTTCSILKQENEIQIASFLSANQDAKELPIEAEWGLKRPYGRQIISGSNNMDGFYFARLEKQTHL